MKSIKLMPDYQCWPLWWGDGCDFIGNINPIEMDLPATLHMQLREWADVYDSFINLKKLNGDQPISSLLMREFENFGIQLWQKLTRHLVHQYRVVFFSLIYARLFISLSEYEKFVQKQGKSQRK